MGAEQLFLTGEIQDKPNNVKVGFSGNLRYKRLKLYAIPAILYCCLIAVFILNEFSNNTLTDYV